MSKNSGPLTSLLPPPPFGAPEGVCSPTPLPPCPSSPPRLLASSSPSSSPSKLPSLPSPPGPAP
ncbi:MAG: hypothetical protein DPW09_44445 [Anaerolineae bacterium]|nr:hypothetical protein [Anaerolineae bacterium]